MTFEGWPLTDAERCDVPDGFEFVDPFGSALWWDDGPVVVLARASDGSAWVCTKADELLGLERWCCAVIGEDDRVRIEADLDAVRARQLWERNAVLVIESEDLAGRALAAWRTSADALRGLRCIFVEEDALATL